MLETEQRNPKTLHIDRMSTAEMIDVINEESRRAVEAVAAAREPIAAAVDTISRALGEGHRLFYVGAGTSGRLAVVDASECPPTFGVSEETVVGIMAGGNACLTKAGEGAEDDPVAGAADLTAHGASRGDVVVGLSASGGAPYVCGALERARESGCVTVAVASNPDTPILRCADIAICTKTGAEVITGSTRMKAGTAQKLVLNTLSTCAMIKTGKVCENLMINLRPTNKKLRARMIGITRDLTGLDLTASEALLEANGWDIRSAVDAAGKEGTPC